MLSVLALAAAQLPPIPIFPVVSRGPVETLTTWRPGSAVCGGVPVRAERLETPFAATDWSLPGSAEVVTLRFRVAADGRPLGIAGGAPYGAGVDIAPALAASRFEGGGERAACTISYAATRVAVEQASATALMGYTVFPNRQPSAAIWQRIRPAGSSCFEPTPALRNRAYPDFEAIPQAPGTTSWSMVGYDLDPHGRPCRAHVVAGTGNQVLDRAAVTAVDASRFGPGARTGCLYPYWRRGPALAAPVTIDDAAVRPAQATCPDTIAWARQPTLVYPENFRRRGIEGWAVIAFDVAPWGETGNVRVLAAEPAAAFGEQAVGIVRQAAARPSAGHVGCTERVRFVMGVPGGRGQVRAVATAPPY